MTEAITITQPGQNEAGDKVSTQVEFRFQDDRLLVIANWYNRSRNLDTRTVVSLEREAVAIVSASMRQWLDQTNT